MKTALQLLAILAAIALIPVSCQDLFQQSRTGTLLITLPEFYPPSTRSALDIPDPGDFRITVTNASGKVVYEDSYARFPEQLPVPEGNYTVSAVSDDFYAPEFDAPQWGDTRVVTVPAGGNVAVDLSCSQLNCGLRLEVDPSFRDAFPDGKLSLKGAEGSLSYAYAEKRTAFFLPGSVTLLLDDGGSVQSLFTRTLEARDMLSIRLCANAAGRSGGITLQVDTLRNWVTDSFVLGGGDAGEIDNAYDVATAREHAGENDVWVWGYIVGVATNSKKVSFSAPFSKSTNLVLGTKATTSDLDHCLSVELPSGAVRGALNLQDHPELLGVKAYLRGDLVSAYYGIPGLKAPSEYRLK